MCDLFIRNSHRQIQMTSIFHFVHTDEWLAFVTAYLYEEALNGGSAEKREDIDKIAKF